MVAGGDFGGDESGCSTHTEIAEVGLSSAKEGNQTVVLEAAICVNAFVFRIKALSLKLAGVLQQPCEAGVFICSH